MDIKTNPRTLRWAKRRDKAARWVITIGGVLIIGAVVLMLLLILNVSIPLFQQPSSNLLKRLSVDSDALGHIFAIGIDDYKEVVYAIHEPNDVTFFDVQSGEILERMTLDGQASKQGIHVTAIDHWSDHRYAMFWSDRGASAVEIRFIPQFDSSGSRTINFEVTSILEMRDANVSNPGIARMRADAGGATLAFVGDDSMVQVVKSTATEDLFGEVSTKNEHASLPTPLPGVITLLELDDPGITLYAGTDEGYLGRWDLSGPAPFVLTDSLKASETGSPITALQTVFGGVSIAIGTANGDFATWFPVTSESSDGKRLQKIHRLPSHTASVVDVVPSLRDKSLITRDSDGNVRIAHMTTERELLSLPTEKLLESHAISAKGDGLILYQKGAITIWDLHKPHPEASFSTLFKKVWYEGYDKPEFVWQSSASSDDYEPKLSLIPLMFGSFKGTLYAMVFAVPLALLAALYTSQFLRPEIAGVVKPAVEIMASVPSVVIGFLIALWLAPLVEGYIVEFFLSIILIPVVFVVFIMIWRLFDGSHLHRKVERGLEFIAVVPVLLGSGFIAYLLAPTVEQALFGGDLKIWLYESVGERYDQRNAIVIAFGLGFAAIPIIFTMAEDALSSLPQSLKAASLALGASRWQTAWRVVLPSASPGIFAAVIIGFGRVIGETMIVLMATGNTPIIDWSPFNGMRTLSANIAVEIPEAPVNGTLYRVLFLSAAILFMLTFVLNTAAEVIRQRLRKKYGQFQ